MAHSDVSRLQNFPVSWFATVMGGLAGLTIALHRQRRYSGGAFTQALHFWH